MHRRPVVRRDWASAPLVLGSDALVVVCELSGDRSAAATTASGGGAEFAEQRLCARRLAVALYQDDCAVVPDKRCPAGRHRTGVPGEQLSVPGDCAGTVVEVGGTSSSIRPQSPPSGQVPNAMHGTRSPHRPNVVVFV